MRPTAAPSAIRSGGAEGIYACGPADVTATTAVCVTATVDDSDDSDLNQQERETTAGLFKYPKITRFQSVQV